MFTQDTIARGCCTGSPFHHITHTPTHTARHLTSGLKLHVCDLWMKPGGEPQRKHNTKAPRLKASEESRRLFLFGKQE